MKKIKIWRKRLFAQPYGYDIILPMSPSTMKIERHDPGGLAWWEELAEIGINIAGLILTGWLTSLVDPVFSALWLVLLLLALGISATVRSNLGFKIFKRRQKSVTVRYEPASIPPELIARYEKAWADLRVAMVELEEIAAEQGIPPNNALRWAAMRAD